jgi:hypothetical protein
VTTVATDGKTMAADQQCGSETIHCHVHKLHRANDGAVLGYCGQAFDQPGFIAWYEGGMEGEPAVSPDFEGMILKPGGEIVCVNEKGHWFLHPAPAAIGSGCRFAYGAMDAGCDPTKAVEIATKRDGFSSGDVETLSPEAPALSRAA